MLMTVLKDELTAKQSIALIGAFFNYQITVNTNMISNDNIQILKTSKQNSKIYRNEIDKCFGIPWCGVEIKLGANQIEEAANNLVKINNEIIKEGGKAARSLCVICGLINAAYRRNDNVYVVPIASLKD